MQIECNVSSYVQEEDTCLNLLFAAIRLATCFLPQSSIHRN